MNENIRNFSIIAHIDHGKSTIADRILELTGALDKRQMQDQILDNMDLERERGITIKLNAVRLEYKGYQLNLIDTPGHVDFTYEVSRSLAACEGAILVVDAAQGIEAQTLANLYLALENDLTIIPVINKIDLPNADIEKVTKELESIGFDKDEIILVSAKNGIRIVDGTLKIGDKIKMLATGATYDVVEMGVHTPKEKACTILNAGEVGFISAAIKSIKDVKVGDTITLDGDIVEPLKGYKPMKPMVFCGIYPLETSKYNDLRDALDKLKLCDAALEYEPETSKALGFGFRCGFLGLLHMDIIEERIRREFNIDLIATSPSVIYEVTLTDRTVINIDSPIKLPDRGLILDVKEPYIRTNIFTPSTYIGPIMELCQNKRGTYVNMEYLDQTRVNIHYEIPLSEIVYDFFDKLKSSTKGYASFDYELIGYKSSNLVKMDILLNGEVVDALSIIVHKDFAYNRGKALVESLRKIIPRQQFEVPIQASIGSKIIARADIKAVRKNVLAKCYGGDVSRKKKLLEKQKEGKKKMKQIGSVELPQEAFLAVLNMEDDIND